MLGIRVLTPREVFVFSTGGTALYADLHDVDDPAEQHRYLAHWLDEFWEANEPPIQQQTQRFKIAAGALVVQIVAWILAVAATLS